MNRPSIGLLLLGLLSIGLGCEQTRSVDRVAADSLLVTQRLARFEKAVTHPDSGDKDSPVALWKLPEALRETSGLTLTADGRLLTHGDEHGKIFEIDYRRGKVVKSFTVGSPAVKGDFEAITRVGDTLWLATMSGKLFRFMEGADEAPVSYDRVDTGLGNSCEFEAMTYEASSNSLLLVCKQVFEKPLKDFLVIFRVPLTPAKNGKEVPPTRLEVPLAKVIGNNPWKEFHPSDIAIDPASGNYVIVASIEKALLELTPAGEVKWSRPLPKGHDQAEGIAISPDHILFISDEANKGPARLTLYRWP